jgi:hypothetical protein
MSAGNRITPGFTAESALAAAGGLPIRHREGGRLPDEAPLREAVTPAAPIRHDGGPRPPGNCMLMCEKVRIVQDMRDPREVRGPYAKYGRRAELSGCSWICVPDPF